MEFWPWWWGALCMGGLVVASWALERRLIAGSGSVTRVATAMVTGAWGREEEEVLDDADALMAALMAATQAEFGEQDGEAPGSADLGPPPGWAPAYAHVVFLVMVALGGFLAALQTGTFAMRWDLGSAFEQLVASDARMVAPLVVGGLMVGFGTRMSSGCTTGHGLCGVSRFQPGSLVATAVFFGMGIATSYALEFLQ